MVEGTSGGRFRFSGKGKEAEYPRDVARTWSHDLLTQTFPSVAAVLEAARFCDTANRQLWANVYIVNEKRMIDAAERVRWYGLEPGPGAVRDAVAQGWPEGVRRINEALADLRDDIAPPVSVKRRRVRSDHGAEVDMSAYWRGRADIAWTDCRRTSTRAPQVVTIAAQISAPGKTHSGDLFWRGAAVLKLADLLTAAGYHVRIDAVRHVRHGYTDHPGRLLQRVTVKEATAPLDVESLAAVLCLSGFFRMFLFACMCSMLYKVQKGCGFTERYQAAPGEVAGVEDCTDADTARAWIRAQLEAITNANA